MWGVNFEKIKFSACKSLKKWVRSKLFLKSSFSIYLHPLASAHIPCQKCKSAGSWWEGEKMTGAQPQLWWIQAQIRRFILVHLIYQTSAQKSNQRLCLRIWLSAAPCLWDPLRSRLDQFFFHSCYTTEVFFFFSYSGQGWLCVIQKPRSISPCYKKQKLSETFFHYCHFTWRVGNTRIFEFIESTDGVNG